MFIKHWERTTVSVKSIGVPRYSRNYPLCNLIVTGPNGGTKCLAAIGIEAAQQLRDDLSKAITKMQLEAFERTKGEP